MMIRNPQLSSQELVGAQMHGMRTFSLKWVSIVVLLIFEIIFISASYHTRITILSQNEDYRIIGCEVEDLVDKYKLYITVESLNGQEQSVEIYAKNGLRDWLWEEPYDEDTNLLPAYETAIITRTVRKDLVGDSLILTLNTFEEQEWEVNLS